jgi:hypothetical protein
LMDGDEQIICTRIELEPVGRSDVRRVPGEVRAVGEKRDDRRLDCQRGRAEVTWRGDAHEHPPVRCEHELVTLAGIRGERHDRSSRQESSAIEIAVGVDERSVLLSTFGFPSLKMRPPHAGSRRPWCCFVRYVVDRAMADHLRTDLPLSALHRALPRRNPSGRLV